MNRLFRWVESVSNDPTYSRSRSRKRPEASRRQHGVCGYDIANAIAQRAAKQQPKEMRSASMSYVRKAIEARWKPRTKVNDNIANAKKSVAARYLQLKSGHAVTGAHLLGIGKVEDAQCWWCGRSSQTIAHLLLRCRKRRRQRDSMMQVMRRERNLYQGEAR